MKPIRFLAADGVAGSSDSSASPLPIAHVKVLMRPASAGEEATFRPGCMSVWEPSPAERRCIAEGANLALIVVGGQPPVWLGLESDA